MSVYRKFRLSSGQKPPAEFSTGILIPGTDWIVWKAPDGTPWPVASSLLTNEAMTQQEIDSVQPMALRRYAARQQLADQEQDALWAVVYALLELVNEERQRHAVKPVTKTEMSGLVDDAVDDLEE